MKDLWDYGQTCTLGTVDQMGCQPCSLSVGAFGLGEILLEVNSTPSGFLTAMVWHVELASLLEAILRLLPYVGKTMKESLPEKCNQKHCLPLVEKKATNLPIFV